MPISEDSINKYLAELVDSKNRYKQLRPLEVEEDLSYISPPHKFTIPTFRHDQKVCFLLGLAHPETMMMTDLGLGKTGVALELLNYFWSNGYIRRAFIFTPTNEVCEGWEDEIKKWGFDLPYIRLTQSSSTEKWKALEEFNNGLVIGTFAGISAMVAGLTDTINKKGKKVRKRIIQPRPLGNLLLKCDAVVFDQSTKVGNKDSLSFKVANEFSSEAQIRYCLAGRAFGRDPFILWAQLYLIDRGKALGRSPWLFREAFWSKYQAPFGTIWRFRKRREKVLNYRVSASSIRYAVDECIDLPPKNYIRKECEFPRENLGYYNAMRDELLKSKGNWRECKSAFLKLRTISSGFVGFIDDDTDDRAQVEFAENPKLNLLMELLDELPEDKKIIIFHEFNFSGQKIEDQLKKRKLKHGRLWGGTKDWTPIKDSFNNDPDYRILVANCRKASMGLNLQVANYCIFYESPVSAIDRYECEGRIYRSGQTSKTFFYDLVLKNSADDLILTFHKEGADLHKALVEDPARILKS